MKDYKYLLSKDSFLLRFRDRQELAFMYVKPPGLESTSKKEESIQEESNEPVVLFSERFLEFQDLGCCEGGS